MRRLSFEQILVTDRLSGFKDREHFLPVAVQGNVKDAALILAGANGSSIVISPKTLVVFVDETGQIQMADPAHPVFGFGACAMLADDYESHLSAPWRALAGIPKHAKGRTLNGRQRKALVQFFQGARFKRMGISVHRGTTFAGFDAIRTCVFYLRKKWLSSLPAECDGIHIILEEGPSFEFWAAALENVAEDIPARMDQLRKGPTNYGIQVADRIAHTVGVHAKNKAGISSSLCPDLLGSVFPNASHPCLAVDTVNFQPQENSNPTLFEPPP